MPKRVIILGSTGSIGGNALEVAGNLPGEFEIVALAAGKSWEKMAEQIERFRPRVAVLTDDAAAQRLAETGAATFTSRTDAPPERGGSGGGTQVWSGPDALVRAVKELECDFVLSAIVGVAGLPATLAAVERGLTVGLANKESLVVAGELIVRAAAASGAELLPVDSEHSAVFQCLHCGQTAASAVGGRRHGSKEVERIFLTASGGPFRTWTIEQMRRVTWPDAMRHPTWNMGPKITIDSATMMNKALEIVEAKWLFGIEPKRIEVVIHPESIIHSMVAFRDGSVVAQMGRPDMRMPIQYAMTYPQRLAGPGNRLDFSKLERMHLEPPDEGRFPALRLGYEVAKSGGTAGAAMNAANEAAVDAFREGRIGFLDIVPIVRDCVAHHPFEEHPSLERLMAADAWSRRRVAEQTSKRQDADESRSRELKTSGRQKVKTAN